MKKIISLFIFFYITLCFNVTAFGGKSPTPAKGEDKKTSTPETPKLERCICPMIYLPVCGEDKKTYSNSCQANCAGVKVTSPGECEKTHDLEKN